MTKPESTLEDSLKAIIRATSPLMSALEIARSVQLDSWCIGAGAIRNVVWDRLHRLNTPQAFYEIDLVHFSHAMPADDDRKLEAELATRLPEFIWDVTNQAHVHDWYAKAFGVSVLPLHSLCEGISTWPEIATCVGAYLTASDELKVIAPFGLADLFALRVVHNPRRASAESFDQRCTTKRWKERWPKLQIQPAKSLHDAAG